MALHGPSCVIRVQWYQDKSIFGASKVMPRNAFACTCRAAHEVGEDKRLLLVVVCLPLCSGASARWVMMRRLASLKIWLTR